MDGFDVLTNPLIFLTPPQDERNIPKDPAVFFFLQRKVLLCLPHRPLAAGLGGLGRFERLRLRGDPPDAAPERLDVFTRGRMQERKRCCWGGGALVLIRGHYLCALSGSWLVSSLQKAGLAGLQPEREGGGRGRGLAWLPRM